MPCPRGPSRGRRREKDSTKITTCTTILDPLNVNSKLRLLIRGITIQLERERERDRGYLTLNEKEVKVDPTKHEFPSPCVTNGKFTLEKDRRDHCLRRENKRNEWNRCIRR